MRKLAYYIGAAAIAMAELIGTYVYLSSADSCLRRFPKFGKDAGSLEITVTGKEEGVWKTDPETYKLLMRTAMIKLGDQTGRARTSFSAGELNQIIEKVAWQVDAVSQPYGILTPGKIGSLNVR